MYPNDPNTMFTLDNVDWTQIPPDNNTGIQFPVQLHTSAALAISDAHVVERNAPRPDELGADLRAQVTNTTRSPPGGRAVGSDHAPLGAADRIAHPLTIPAGATGPSR